MVIGHTFIPFSSVPRSRLEAFFDAGEFRHRAPDSRCGDRKIFRFSQTDQKSNDYDYDCRLQAAKSPRDYKTVTPNLKNAYSGVFRCIYVEIWVSGDYNLGACSATTSLVGVDVRHVDPYNGRMLGGDQRLLKTLRHTR